MATYLDASALVKLVVTEPESAALERFLEDYPVWVSCALAKTEVPRAVARHDYSSIPRALALLADVRLFPLTDPLLDAASEVVPPDVRSLDAIHVAAALQLEGELEALITYDTRMIDVARVMGIVVAAPGAPHLLSGGSGARPS